ncbi:MAG TPA: CPBP family intramembrane metalloprotease [Prolixibacteraceae bacterium]|nr:CPBP family intramembrane metalloprotease [Prolixibacteraceae bacterium]
MKPQLKPTNILQELLLFGIPSVAFVLVCRLLIPELNLEYRLHPALSWFLGGLLIFLPLFLLTFYLVRKDGFRTNSEIRERLRLQKMSSRDWKFTIFSTLAILLLTGTIMSISKFLHAQYGIPEIETTPSFMAFEPFQGSQRYLLLVWLIMFFFNIFGEELLWRGYILPRQEIRMNKFAWFFNALLWILFHICFGIQLMILLFPILFILPWAVQKTQNTWVGITIHALVNGPSFIMISLGVIG